MSAAAPTRRVVKAGAAAPSQSTPTLADRLDEWLVLWGDWVRAYSANSVSTKNLGGVAFKDVPSNRQWQTTLEVLEDLKLEDRTLRDLDACIADLIKLHYLILHWHYARAYKRRGPAVWRHNQLPADASPEYDALLADARAALAVKVTARHVLIPE